MKQLIATQWFATKLNRQEFTIMNGKLFALGGLVALFAFAPSFTLPGQSQVGAAPRQGKMGKMGKEKHPEIRRAIKNLEQAKNSMTHAASDFGGHRVKALELTEQAIAELKLALASDKN